MNEQENNLTRLPEDCVLQILEHLSFPLHRYVKYSTLNNNILKSKHMIQLLYGYFPLSSLSHRTPYLLYRNIAFNVPQCVSHRGTLMAPLRDNHCFELLPKTDLVHRFSIASNVFFEHESLTATHLSCIVSRLTALKKLTISYHMKLNDTALDYLRSCLKLVHLELFGTNVTLNGLTDHLLDETFLPELQTLIVNESGQEAVSNENVASLPMAIGNREQLAHVELTNHTCIDDSVVADLLKHKQLTHLNIANSIYITSNAFQHLKDNKTLQVLNVSGCTGIGNDSVEYFLENTSLNHLDVSKCSISDRFGELLCTPSKIKTLVLQGSLPRSYSIKSPADDMPHLPYQLQNRYENLNFGFNVELGAGVVSHVIQYHNRSLQKLELNNCKLSMESCKVIFNQELPALELLDLSANDLTDEVIMSMYENVTKHPRLFHLIAHHNQFTQLGAQTLAQIPQLTKLDLSFCKIGDEGAAILLSSNKFVMLSLRGNSLSDVAFTQINLTSVTSLQSLELASNRITPTGAKHILLLPNVSTLDLCMNRLSDDIIPDILQNKALRSLLLKKNRLSKQGTIKLLSQADRITHLVVDSF
jgi:hypothetical protein